MKRHSPKSTNADPYRIGVVFLHPACNMSCTYCITDDRLDTMTFEQARTMIDLIRRRSIANVVLGGGEPFAWPHDTAALAAWAKSRGCFVQVGTNGIAMPENPGEVDAIDRYVLPLDAAAPAVHNALRRHGPGHHALILRRLDALRRARKSVTISTVVTARNLAHLPALAEGLSAYAEQGGLLHAWHLYKFIPEGRGGRMHADELAVSEQTYQDACRRVKKLCDGFIMYKRRDMRHSKSVDFFWFEEAAVRVGSEYWEAPSSGNDG